MKFLEYDDLASLTAMLSGVDTGDSIINGRVEAYSCTKIQISFQTFLNDHSSVLSPLISLRLSGKAAGTDKRTSKDLERHITEDLASSSPTLHSDSSLGDLSDPSVRKLLITLICTLNQSYPDYDFSNASPLDFGVEPSYESALDVIREHLGDSISASAAAAGHAFATAASSLSMPSSASVVGVSSGNDDSDHESSSPSDQSGIFYTQLVSALNHHVDLSSCDVFAYNSDIEDGGDAPVLWSLHYFFFNKKLKKLVFFTAWATRFVCKISSSKLRFLFVSK